MSVREPKNVAASVRARLLEVMRGRREEFELTLTRYALERLLFRIGRSDYREKFVLKGAMLFALWGVEQDLTPLSAHPSSLGRSLIPRGRSHPCRLTRSPARRLLDWDLMSQVATSR
jgi:hypothetical protein